MHVYVKNVNEMIQHKQGFFVTGEFFFKPPPPPQKKKNNNIISKLTMLPLKLSIHCKL